MRRTIVPTEAPVTRLRRLRVVRRAAAESDHALVARVSQGDEAALSELYDRYGVLAYRVAAQVTQDTTSAEDAVQEAFVQLWLHASTIDPSRTSVSAWVVLLARRRAIDLARRETRATRPLLPRAFELESPAADTQALAEHERQWARNALAELMPGQREVIELAYYRGLSQSEIARALAIPLGTVKSRTQSALACLRRALTECSEPAPVGQLALG